jgi:hypothetical protein
MSAQSNSAKQIGLFLPHKKNLAGDSHPARWPSIFINSSEVRALMAHPATAEDDHLQLH